MGHRSRGAAAALGALGLAGAVALVPAAAQAHSLDSSTLSVHETTAGASMTVSLPLEALDEAAGTSYATTGDVADWGEEVATYVADHLTVTGADGGAWTETLGEVSRETIEGIDSVSVELTLDAGGGDTSGFTIDYDAIVDAIDGHEAVAVLTDLAGDVSTAGVLTADDPTVSIGDVDVVATATSLADMVGYGFHHVLAGADHLLFLLALLLPAPLLLAGARRRWGGPGGLRSTARNVLAVVTAFTIGHSVTLVASALGWVDVPSTPVEVAIAVSVGVAAVHAMRPLVRRGDVLVAGLFGLVHGLAFAGILTDLGLDGSLSLLTLLAFNVGVELAQLVVVTLVFPSLLVVSRTGWYPVVRRGGASLALALAVCWALDRLGVLTDPMAPAESWAVGHPWTVVAGCAAVAALATLLAPRARPAQRDGVGEPGLVPG